MDDYVREYIRKNLSFRYVLMKRGKDCFALEKHVQTQGLYGEIPFINGKVKDGKIKMWEGGNLY